jgi:hypothetical protein
MACMVVTSAMSSNSHPALIHRGTGSTLDVLSGSGFMSSQAG